MNIRTWLGLAVAAASGAFALGGCPALDALSGDLVLDKDYFPFKNDLKWVYQVTRDGTPLGTATMSLSGVATQVEGGVETGTGSLKLELPNPESASPSARVEIWEIRKTAGAIQLEGQQPLMKLPIRVGDSWSAGATSDVVAIQAPMDPQVVVVGTQRVEFTWKGEKVSSPSVRIDLKAFGLNENGEADTSKLRSPVLRRWFVAGVGLVRQTSTLAPLENVTLELQDVKGL